MVEKNIWNIRDFMVWLLISVFLIQGISILLNQLFHIEVIRLGWFLLWLLIFFGLYLLLVAIEGGIKGNAKIDSPYLILFALIAGALVGLYYYLPQLIPQAFSITSPPAMSSWAGWLAKGTLSLGSFSLGLPSLLILGILVILIVIFPLVILPAALGFIGTVLKNNPLLSALLIGIAVIWILKLLKSGKRR